MIDALKFATLLIAGLGAVLFGFAPIIRAVSLWHCWWLPHVPVCQ